MSYCRFIWYFKSAFPKLSCFADWRKERGRGDGSAWVVGERTHATPRMQAVATCVCCSLQWSFAYACVPTAHASAAAPLGMCSPTTSASRGLGTPVLNLKVLLQIKIHYGWGRGYWAFINVLSHLQNISREAGDKIRALLHLRDLSWRGFN